MNKDERIYKEAYEICLKDKNYYRHRCKELSAVPNRTLVLILGILSCLTLIGIFWGMPLIGKAFNERWELC